MPRGKKTCSSCGCQTGPRSYTCPQCGASFNIQGGSGKLSNGRRGRDFNWQDLERNDCIRVVSGTGPYWQGKTDRTPMGYWGLFKVHRVMRDGLLCFSVEKNGSESSFIYMGKDKIGKTGTIMRPHKIRKVETRFIRKTKNDKRKTVV